MFPNQKSYHIFKIQFIQLDCKYFPKNILFTCVHLFFIKALLGTKLLMEQLRTVIIFEKNICQTFFTVCSDYRRFKCFVCVRYIYIYIYIYVCDINNVT